MNIICLDKEAPWKFPVWNNILVQDKHPEMRASAVICDHCVDRKREPEFAVEFDGKTVKYHPVKDLKDAAPISEQEVVEAELRGFGGVARHR